MRKSKSSLQVWTNKK